MKTILNSRKHYYVKSVSIFLIIVALIAGMMGCDDDGPYDLTISSALGGSVTATFDGNETVIGPGKTQTISDIPAGTVVALVAEPQEGYSFIKWTSDVDIIKDVNAVSANITMNATYSITANLAEEIWDWQGLNAIRDNLGGSYCLMSTLVYTTANYTELASEGANGESGWEPIGTSDDPFTGSFYGQGYEISDLFIDRPEENYVGLFGLVYEGGVIENVRLVDATVTGNYCVGGMVGYNKGGTVTYSYSTGSVTGWLRVGGLVGWNQDTVNNSYSAAHVTYSRSVGGLVGYNTGTVNNSYSSGSVSGYVFVGGLVGTNHIGGTVSDCYSNTAVAGERYVGGLVGFNYWKVSNSFWDTKTSEQGSSAGGTGKTTAELKNIATFSDAGWNIIAVADPGTRNPDCIWNIVDGQTYPFLSWQSVV
jgi:hypothetical protein